MRHKRAIFVAIVILAGLIISGSAFAEPQRARLAVREFDNKAGCGIPAAAITEMMTTELFKAGLFNLVEREKLHYVGEEIKLGQSGLVDESTAPELGKIKGAQYTMTGAVTLYFYNSKGGVVVLPGVVGGLLGRTAYVTLDIRIIDNATSEIVYAAAEQGSADRTFGGLGTVIGGFGGGTSGGLLASATRDSVVKHTETLTTLQWRGDY